MRVMTLKTRSDALLSTTSPTPPRNLLTMSPTSTMRLWRRLWRRRRRR
ncbi:unnamed protein product [Heligmosomoides polygyrus]|uniref:Uncharacterized protein n=1 Tax=Heligmosomoides polygyrus TaxID=6339 RepID=A0A183GUB4_HELPZ|nr:unnamed protein product [Heligmosomoides polygyrus]